jgi:hypothetical protein
MARPRRRGVPRDRGARGLRGSLVLSAYLAYWWRRRAGSDAGPGARPRGLAGASCSSTRRCCAFRRFASLAALVRVSDLPVGARRSPRAACRWL